MEIWQVRKREHLDGDFNYISLQFLHQGKLNLAYNVYVSNAMRCNSILCSVHWVIWQEGFAMFYDEHMW